jgi:hypothetical protein
MEEATIRDRSFARRMKNKNEAAAVTRSKRESARMNSPKIDCTTVSLSTNAEKLLDEIYQAEMARDDTTVERLWKNAGSKLSAEICDFWRQSIETPGIATRELLTYGVKQASIPDEYGASFEKGEFLFWA